MSLYDTCFLCKKKDSGNTEFCDCGGEAGAPDFCEVCKDQLNRCVDCGGIWYCGECFFKPEHDLCTLIP